MIEKLPKITGRFYSGNVRFFSVEGEIYKNNSGFFDIFLIHYQKINRISNYV